MAKLARVVWSEGMYLGPHHFQAQAHYFEDTVHFAASALWFAGHGLAACELDAEALHNGTLSLVRARGIMPDGLVFEMPDCDPLPVPRPIAELFPPLADRLTVYLGIPAYRFDAVNCTPPDAGPDSSARYLSEVRQLHDENTGRDESRSMSAERTCSSISRRNSGGPGHPAAGASDAGRRRAFHLRPDFHPALHADQRQRAADAACCGG